MKVISCLLEVEVAESLGCVSGNMTESFCRFRSLYSTNDSAVNDFVILSKNDSAENDFVILSTNDSAENDFVILSKNDFAENDSVSFVKVCKKKYTIV